MMRLRRLLRDGLFGFARKFSRTDDAREMAAGTLTGLLDGRPRLACSNSAMDLDDLPYPDLGQPPRGIAAGDRDDVLFITARFRSGSTLLWNLFRNLPGVTAYYEPFNERRWFDAAKRGERIDRTHKKVEEYWREYDGLEELGRYYCESWIERHLLMEAHSWAPDMKRYVELLIERAPGRPVLQFNRVDFRLPWLRANFPRAKIVHLYRHPRDQWCSTLMGIDCFPKDADAAGFPRHDKFYLLNWARDLHFHFPFLANFRSRHPYETFYLIWRLSYLYGLVYGDYSVCFEKLVTDTERELVSLLRFAGVEQSHAEQLQSLIETPKLGQWRAYADHGWFTERESRCEVEIRDFVARNCPRHDSLCLEQLHADWLQQEKACRV
ncbi:MAG TPA: sulfotransferase [Pirellulales bacterium]|nr:sulfotransferase [Pirellulales bacterium]